MYLSQRSKTSFECLSCSKLWYNIHYLFFNFSTFSTFITHSKGDFNILIKLNNYQTITIFSLTLKSHCISIHMVLLLPLTTHRYHRQYSGTSISESFCSQFGLQKHSEKFCFHWRIHIPVSNTISPRITEGIKIKLMNHCVVCKNL